MDDTDKDFVPQGDTPTARRKAEREREKPRYYLVTPQYIGDMYYTDDQEIIYSGTPNEGMEPRNAAAEDKMDAWLESLPAPTMRHEDFIANAIANRPRHEMAAPPTAPKRRPSRLMGKEPAEDDGTVEVVPQDMSRVKGPKKQMGTIVSEVPSPGSI